MIVNFKSLYSNIFKVTKVFSYDDHEMITIREVTNDLPKTIPSSDVTKKTNIELNDIIIWERGVWFKIEDDALQK
ncbi:MAG: hypothetical protein ACRC4M_04140 [Mycoplasma sp.]